KARLMVILRNANDAAVANEDAEFGPKGDVVPGEGEKLDILMAINTGLQHRIHAVVLASEDGRKTGGVLNPGRARPSLETAQIQAKMRTIRILVQNCIEI
ncbi:hypothetical protein SAMN04487972_1631, partial [Paracoccus halophilus]